MIIDQFLNESSLENELSTVEAIPGYGIAGGAERALSEAAQELHKMTMGQMLSEVHSIKLISESQVDEALLLQENVLKTIWDKFIGVIKSLYGKMKGFLDNAGIFFSKLLTGDQFLKKYKSRIKDGEKIDVQGFEFSLDKVDPQKIYADCSKIVDDKYKGFKAQTLGEEDTAKVEEIKKAKKAIDDAKDAFRKEIIGAACSGCTSDSELKKGFFKELRGGKDSKSSITSYSASEIISELESAKGDIAIVNDLKKAISVTHNQAIQKVNLAKKEVSDVTETNKPTKEYNAIVSQALKDHCSNLVYCLSISNRAVSSKIDAIKARKGQAQSIGRAVLMASGKSTKESSKTEKQSNSTIDDFMSQFA